MNSTLPAYIGGIVRLFVAVFGGWLTQKGLSDQGTLDSIGGAAIIVVTGIWSIWAKRQALYATPPETGTKPLPPAALILLIALVPSLFMTGCAVISGKAGESHYVGLAFGEKASTTLAGLNITETTTAKGQVVTERGVGIDKAGSEGQADMGKILGNLLLLGLQSQGIPVKAQASAASPSSEVIGQTSEVGTEPTSDATVGLAAPPVVSAKKSKASTSNEVVYSTDGYGGSPGASGEGIYGRPSCGRCQAYHSAHPDAAIINLDEAANRAAMWAALRRLGFTGSVANLPVVISATSYGMSAQ